VQLRTHYQLGDNLTADRTDFSDWHASLAAPAVDAALARSGRALNAAGFVSSYRGSLLDAYDQQLWRARKTLEAHHVRFSACGQ